MNNIIGDNSRGEDQAKCKGHRQQEKEQKHGGQMSVARDCLFKDHIQGGLRSSHQGKDSSREGSSREDSSREDSSRQVRQVRQVRQEKWPSRNGRSFLTQA